MDDGKQKLKSKEIQKKIIIILGALSIGLLGTGAAISYSSQPSFCTNCHEVAPSVAGWEQGTHSKVDCLACHADPGLVGKIKIKVGGLQEVKVHLTEDLTNWDLRGHVPNERCLTCHEAKMNKIPTFVRDIHEQALKGEGNCGQCHRSAIHGEREYKAQ